MWTGSSPSTNDAAETNQTEAVGNVTTENSSNENIEGEAVGKEQGMMNDFVKLFT